MGVLIGRPINGVTINGLEFVLNDDGSEMIFKNETEARNFLHEHNLSDRKIKRCGIEFINEEKLLSRK